MKCVDLTIREGQLGAGIFPDFQNDDQRRLELRARTVLAYGYVNGHIKPWIVTDGETRMVLLDVDQTEVFEDKETAWPLTHEVNTGCIYIPNDLNAGWSEQPGRMVMFVDSTISIDHALRSYFQSSIRWLDDRGYAKAALDKLFQKV